MNWSAFSTASAAHSQEHKRALLLEQVRASKVKVVFCVQLVIMLLVWYAQALIQGSALVGDTCASSFALTVNDASRRSSTSPARVQHTPDRFQPGTIGTTASSLSPPTRTFQHTVRGRSPTVLRSLCADTSYDAASLASLSPPAAPEPSPRHSVDLEFDRPVLSRGLRVEPLPLASNAAHESPHVTAHEAWQDLVDTYESAR